MFPDVDYKTQSVSLAPGDTAVLFTDGITESRNKENKQFEEEKLIRFLKKHAKSPAQELMDKIYTEVGTFTSGVEQMDDMTLVVIKRT